MTLGTSTTETKKSKISQEDSCPSENTAQFNHYYEVAELNEN